MQKRFVAFLIAVLVAAGAGLATAQERFGGLTGIVTDASGGVLPGATVTITSKTTGASRTQVTSADGVYTVPDLDPGRYAVIVELSGFSKTHLDDVIVSLGKTLRSWRAEILAHHTTGASNGPTEGLNLCVKKVKRCGHGFRSFDHYRLRVLLHAGGVTWPAHTSLLKAKQYLLTGDRIPSPYRHHARSGSPFSVTRISSLVGLGRVVT